MVGSWWPNKAIPSARPLRTWLALRIVLAGVLPLIVVAVLVLWILLPQLREDLETLHQTLARALAGQIEAHLLGAGRELRALATDLHGQDHQPTSFWLNRLDAHAGTGDVFAAIYIIASDDSVHAVGLPPTQRTQRNDLLKLDLSKWPALREARERNEATWSETFLSAVTGRLAVTLAIPVADQMLIGEIVIDRLSEFIARLPAESGMLTMILDRQGQIIAHSQTALSGQQHSLGHLPIVRDALQGPLATRGFEWDGEPFVGTAVSVPQLGWIVLVAQPRHEALRPLLSTLGVLAAGALVALLLAILVALTLARGFAQRIGRYAEQAHAITEGDYDQPWPVSRIREFDGLASDLERMSLAIRQRERDLATSEARYRSVIGSAPVMIFQFDQQGVFTLSEGKGLARVGLVAGEAVGQSLFELYRSYPKICEYARRAIGGETLQFISRIDEIYFDTYFNPARDSEGHIQVMGVSVDITERKRAEEALRKNEDRLRQVVRVSQLGIFEHDHLTDLIYWSPEQRKIHGWGADEPVTLPAFLESVHPNDRAMIAAAVQRAHEPTGNGLYDVEHRIIRNGEIRWIVTRSQTSFEGEGIARHKVRTVGADLDITERKRAEEELRQHRERLEELVAERTAELRQAMTQLVQSEKLAALGQLVAGVAHELNTPLGNARVVAGALGAHLREFTAAVEAGALRRSQVDAFLARGREAVDLLERNAARAADLIGHFKQVAVDQTSMRRRRFLLRRTVEELLATLQPQFKRTAHRVDLDLPPDLELDSYPGPLEQVLANLIANSLIHGFAGIETGTIRIHAASPNAVQVHIDYTDNGVGIPEKILKRIFEPFFTTQLGSGGSGLGLYIVYNLVTGVLGGTIQSHSVVGQGIRFTLVLPRIGPDQPVVELPV